MKPTTSDHFNAWASAKLAKPILKGVTLHLLKTLPTNSKNFV